MQEKVRMFYAIGLLIVGSLLSGCWVFRNWIDYLPLTSVGLTPDSKTYVGYFVPRHSGRHMLSLRIRRHGEDGNVAVGLRIHGIVRTYWHGHAKEYPIEVILDQVTLPPGMFDVRLGEFPAEKATDPSQDYGSFHLEAEGDLSEFLSGQPESMFSVSFDETE